MKQLDSQELSHGVCVIIRGREQQFLATHGTEVVVLRGGESTDVRWTHTAEHWTSEAERIFE